MAGIGIRKLAVMLARVTTTDKSGLPKVGQPAPDFTLPSTDDQDVSLSSFKGKQAVVLYFYPRDDTPGCTTEACSVSACFLFTFDVKFMHERRSVLHKV